MFVFNQVTVKHVNGMLDCWSERVRSSHAPVSVELFDWLKRLTVDVMGDAMFARDFAMMAGATFGDSSSKKTNDEHVDALGPATEALVHFTSVSVLAPLKALVPITHRDEYVRFRNARAYLRRLSQEMLDVERQKRQQRSTDQPGDRQQRQNLLQLLLAARDADARPDAAAFSDDELVDESVTFLLASFETTVATLLWALKIMHEPANHKDLVKVHAEVDRVFNDTKGAITYETVTTQLPYLTAAIKETQRLIPGALCLFNVHIRHSSLCFSSCIIEFHTNDAFFFVVRSRNGVRSQSESRR